MNNLAEQFGVIPFLVETLLTEETDTVKEMYAKISRKEKRYLFSDKKEKKNNNIENSIIRKIKRIIKKETV